MATSLTVAPSSKPIPKFAIVLQNQARAAYWSIAGCGDLRQLYFQLWWFWSKCIHQIDIDGIDYVGIALKLRQRVVFVIRKWIQKSADLMDHCPDSAGCFSRREAGFSRNISGLCWTDVRPCVTTVASRKSVAGTAALLFSLSRGVAFDAVAMITPDLLLTAIVLVYFLVLLEFVRHDRYSAHCSAWFTLLPFSLKLSLCHGLW